jgi:hypothetical protein
MTRADKRTRRLQEHDRWLKWTGRRCIACGRELHDDDLLEGVNPREPRPCANCCGAEGVIVDTPPGQRLPPGEYFDEAGRRVDP